MSINARHRKHYKAGAVWQAGEQVAAEERAENWVRKFLRRLQFGKNA